MFIHLRLLIVNYLAISTENLFHGRVMGKNSPRTNCPVLCGRRNIFDSSYTGTCKFQTACQLMNELLRCISLLHFTGQIHMEMKRIVHRVFEHPLIPPHKNRFVYCTILFPIKLIATTQACHVNTGLYFIINKIRTLKFVSVKNENCLPAIHLKNIIYICNP